MTYELLFGLRCTIWCAVYLALVVAGQAVLHKWRRKLLAALIINLAACVVMFGITKPAVTLLNISMFGVTGRGFSLMLLILSVADIARVLLAGSNLAVMRRGWAFWVVGLLIACGTARYTARDDRQIFEFAVNYDDWDRAVTGDPMTHDLAVTLKRSFPRDYDAILVLIAKRYGKPDKVDSDDFPYLVSIFLRSQFANIASAPDNDLVLIARQMVREGESGEVQRDCEEFLATHDKSVYPFRQSAKLLLLQVRAARDGFDHPVRRDFAHPPPQYVAELRQKVPPALASTVARASGVLNQPSFPPPEECAAVRDIVPMVVPLLSRLSSPVLVYFIASGFDSKSRSEYALPQ
jgi:hypothetical protein